MVKKMKGGMGWYDDAYSRPLQQTQVSKEMELPIGVSTVVFLIFVLIVSSYELYLGSPSGLSLTKLATTLVFGAFIELVNRIGPDHFSWAILMMYFTAYFTITIVSTSCARGDSDDVTPALETIRDHGLLSPFVLSKHQLKQLHGKHKSDDDDDDDDNSQDSTLSSVLSSFGLN